MTTRPISDEDLLQYLAECRRDVADVRTMLAEIRDAVEDERQ